MGPRLTALALLMSRARAGPCGGKNLKAAGALKINTPPAPEDAEVRPPEHVPDLRAAGPPAQRRETDGGREVAGPEIDADGQTPAGEVAGPHSDAAARLRAAGGPPRRPPVRRAASPA